MVSIFSVEFIALDRSWRVLKESITLLFINAPNLFRPLEGVFDSPWRGFIPPSGSSPF